MTHCPCGQGLLFGTACDACGRRARRVNNKAGRDHRRYVRLTRIEFIIKVDADRCGVCLGPLLDVPYRHPMSTTIGHEPPLAVAARDGWLTVVERPEHLICNLRKGTLTDDSLMARVTV